MRSINQSSRYLLSDKEAITHANTLRKNVKAFALLDELDRCTPLMHEASQVTLNFWGHQPGRVDIFFRELLLKAWTYNYLRYILKNTSGYLCDLEEPAISILS